MSTTEIRTDATRAARAEEQAGRALSRAGFDRASIALAEIAQLLAGAVDPAQSVPDIRFPVRSLKAGETLHRAGDRFEAIYVVRSGFLKTVSVDRTGEEQVLAFPMGGDVIGLDGLDAERYASDVVALDATQVAVVSFARIARLGHEYPSVERLLYAAFSREMIRGRNMIWLLGTLHAEARLATFLLDLAERFGRLGYSRSSFALRMSREEIGSYLGIKLETVSRAFSAFAAAGLIAVDRKEIALRDLAGLRRVVQPPADERPVQRVRAARPAAARNAPAAAAPARARPFAALAYAG
jgi:CRP/FNR family transcriptional regulator